MPARTGRYERAPTTRKNLLALMALVILAVLGGTVWASERATTDETSIPNAYRAAQAPAQDGTADRGDVPALRPHPRGLPRRSARPRVRWRSRGRGPNLAYKPGEAGSGYPGPRAPQGGRK